MDYIFGVFKADWKSREKYFASFPTDFLIDRFLTAIVGFPICFMIINWLINLGSSPYVFIPVVISYWLMSIFLVWRILRSLRRSCGINKNDSEEEL